MHGQANGLAAALGAIPLAPYILRRQLPSDAVNAIRSLLRSVEGTDPAGMNNSRID